MKDGQAGQQGKQMIPIEALYQDHRRALLGYLTKSFSWCGSPQDMLQETFLRALRQKERLQEAVSPRAWLFGVARHVGLTAARSRRPMQTLTESAAEAPRQSPEIADLRDQVEALPAAMREALELRLRDGLTYEEIAHVLQIPVGTVRSRLHTAVTRLRQAMQDS